MEVTIPDRPVAAMIPRTSVFDGGDDCKIVSKALSQTTNRQTIVELGREVLVAKAGVFSGCWDWRASEICGDMVVECGFGLTGADFSLTGFG